MRPCRHCAQPIGLRDAVCPHCRGVQTPTIGLTSTPPSTRACAEEESPAEPDSSEVAFLAAMQLSPIAVPVLTAFLGYMLAGIPGLMLALFVGVVLVVIVLSVCQGG
jgi:hypothetical protein